MYRSPLDKIKVAAPCNAEWRWMYGNDRVRFCGQCSKNVYNLSAMSREEAEDLIRRTEGQLCVRFYRRADGTILSGADCPVGVQAIRKKLSKWATAIVAAALSFFANIGLVGLAGKESVERAVTQGQMVIESPLPLVPLMGGIMKEPSETVGKAVPTIKTTGRSGAKRRR